MEIPNNLESFRKELDRKGYRKNSIDNYISYCSVFLNRYKERKCPKHISEQDIKDFLRGFTEHNTQRAYHSAIKAFYKYVANQPNKFRYIEYCKRSRKLPIVLSPDEIQRMFNVCTNLKHKAIFAVLYACGLRVSEVINLRISDIDGARSVIHIIQGKGGKDRQVMLPQSLLLLLRQYYIQYRPKEYLFNGQSSLQYSSRSINEFLKDIAKKAGINNKRIYAHLIRHCTMTHMLEQGTDISIIQKVAGHSSPKTTQLYTHISNTLISRTHSPLSSLRL